MNEKGLPGAEIVEPSNPQNLIREDPPNPRDPRIQRSEKP